MKTVLLSFWRNDAARSLDARVRALLLKQDVWRHVWIVGDSSDDTAAQLYAWSGQLSSRLVDVLRADTGIVGEDIGARRRRISATETRAYSRLAEAPYLGADWVVQHESDLWTGPSVVRQLLWDRDPRAGQVWAGWPTLDLPDGPTVFYDTWGYRHLDGRHFTADEPRPSAPLEVASVGSVWAAPAAAWRGQVVQQDCCVELCANWRRQGLTIWVDPSVEVVQPASLWTPTLPS